MKKHDLVQTTSALIADRLYTVSDIRKGRKLRVQIAVEISV